MTTRDKSDWLLFGTLIAVLVIWWYIRTRRTADSAAPDQSDTLPPSVQWGGNSPFAGGGSGNNPQAEYITNAYDVPIPHFTAGPEQMLMPMFGFVGYSSVGTN